MDKSFLRKLDRLLISTRKIIKGSGGGIRRSSDKGSSIEFSDYREYIAGDDFRYIDWNTYARFEKLYIKQFMEEQETTVTIFLDASKSMDFGEPNKAVLAKNLVAVFSYIALSGLDRVSVAKLRGNDIDISNIFVGKQNFFKLYEYIEDTEFGGETYISQAMKKAQFLSSRGGISIIISDLFSKDGYKDALDYLLYKKQDVILLNILSPQEMEPSFNGSMQLIDAEDGETLDVMVSKNVLNHYRENVQIFLNENKEYCYTKGIYYIPIVSDMEIEKIVFDKLMKQGILK